MIESRWKDRRTREYKGRTHKKRNDISSKSAKDIKEESRRERRL